MLVSFAVKNAQGAIEPCRSHDSCLPDVIDFKWKDEAQLSRKRALLSVDIVASRTYHHQLSAVIKNGWSCQTWIHPRLKLDCINWLQMCLSLQYSHRQLSTIPTGRSQSHDCGSVCPVESLMLLPSNNISKINTVFADSECEQVITVSLQPWESFGSCRISKRMWGIWMSYLVCGAYECWTWTILKWCQLLIIFKINMQCLFQVII